MCKLNLKLTAGPFGIEIEEEQQMSCAKFEPQWAYEWQIKDSDCHLSLTILTYH